MRLGLLADIHEQVEPLRIALERFRQEQVDQVVVIGDVFETGERIEETCHLLAEAQAVGVWGNHDYGLGCDPPDAIRVRYSASIITFMKSLRPRLERGRYFVVVGALSEGRFAILDTETSDLVPLRTLQRAN